MENVNNENNNGVGMNATSPMTSKSSQTSNGSVASSTTTPSTPLSTPMPGGAKKSNTTTIVIVVVIILVLLCCCCGGLVALASRDGTGRVTLNPGLTNNETTPTTQEIDPTDEPTSSPTPIDKPNYINGTNRPPASTNFSAEVVKKTRKLKFSDGYYTNVNALGKPSSYTFSMLYKPDWTTSKFDDVTFILQSSNKNLQTGVLYFGAGNEEFESMSCYEVVQGIFKQYKWEGKNEGKVSMNGDSWDKVSYSIDKGTSKELYGVDQCLKREDAMILYFFVTTKAEWDSKKSEYEKVISDMYVSKTGIKY